MQSKEHSEFERLDDGFDTREWDTLLAVATGDPSISVDIASLRELERRGFIRHLKDGSFRLTEAGQVKYDSLDDPNFD